MAKQNSLHEDETVKEMFVKIILMAFAVKHRRTYFTFVCLLSITVMGLLLYCRQLQPRGFNITRQRAPITTDFQVIENMTAYGYSAYIDDRPTRDIPPSSTGPVLRVFAYLLRHLDPINNWKCVLYYTGGRTRGLITSLISITELNHSPQLRYRVVMLLCALPPNSSLQSPHHVSILTDDYLINHCNFTDCRHNASDCVSRTKENNQTMCSVTGNITANWSKCNKTDMDCRSAENAMNFINLPGDLSLIPVTDLRQERKFQEKELTTNFTVCVSPLFGSLYDWQDVLKFIEINRVLGASKFIFYVSSNVRATLTKFLLRYSKERKNLIEIYPYNPINAEGLHYNGQIICITECVYRTMYRTRYMISQDIDELIVPMRTSSWSEMIQHLNTKHPGKNLAAANFRNVFFPTTIPSDSAYGNNTSAALYNIEPLLKMTREKHTFGHNDRSKVMLRPEVILIVHVHYVENQNIIDPQNNPSVHVSEEDGLLFHYKELSVKKNTTVPNLRMQDFAAVIQEHVHSEMQYFSKN